MKQREVYAVMKIIPEDPFFRIKFPYNPYYGQPQNLPVHCMKNIKENILSPTTWEINGTNPDPVMKHLLVFHLLPQRASRRKVWNGHRFEIHKNPPEGPKCDDLKIIFVSDKILKLIDFIFFNFSQRITTNC